MNYIGIKAAVVSCGFLASVVRRGLMWKSCNVDNIAGDISVHLLSLALPQDALLIHSFFTLHLPLQMACPPPRRLEPGCPRSRSATTVDLLSVALPQLLRRRFRKGCGGKEGFTRFAEWTHQSSPSLQTFSCPEADSSQYSVTGRAYLTPQTSPILLRRQMPGHATNPPPGRDFYPHFDLQQWRLLVRTLGIQPHVG